MDVARGTLSRLAWGFKAVWSPDGGRLALHSAQDGLSQIYLQPIDSSESAELLYQSTEAQNVNDWSPDGRYVVFDSQSPTTARDLWSVMVDGADRKPTAFLQTSANEARGAFSPDGKWLAYQSDETGELAVFARPFPGPGRAWRVSTGSGTDPFWRADGGEVYYVADGQLLAVSVMPRGDALDLGTPTALFSTAGTVRLSARSDGRRFLVATLTEDVPPSPLTVIVNWNRRVR
jgi:Tol biopolymer transport system component